MPKVLITLDKGLEKIELYCIGFSTIIFAVIMFANVVLRNFFQMGLAWSNEVSSYLNIFAVYLAISAGFKYKDHVGVTAFVDFCIPKKIRKHFDTLSNAICIVFCVIVCYFSCKMVSNSMNTGQVSLVLQIPLWLIYLCMVLGMVGSIIRLIMEIVKIYYKDKEIEGGAKKC